MRRKASQDRSLDIEKEQGKRRQMQAYIKGLGEQIANKSAEKQAQLEINKLPGGTTLLLHQKTDKCYNCTKCRNRYPLKMLNKNKRVYV